MDNADKPEAVSLTDAFEMGYSFALDTTRPQSREDSRAIGRLLGCNVFDPISKDIDRELRARGFVSFKDADHGIMAAKAIIHAALALLPTQGLAVVEGEALDGYRAAISFVGSDAWDGCSDCIEILKAARAADWSWDRSNDANKIAADLARIRQHYSEAERAGGEAGK